MEKNTSTGRIPSLGVGGINIRPLGDTTTGMYTPNTLPEMQYERGKVPTMPSYGTAPTMPSYGTAPVLPTQYGSTWTIGPNRGAQWYQTWTPEGAHQYYIDTGRSPSYFYQEYLPWMNAKNAASTDWYNTATTQYNTAKTSAENWYNAETNNYNTAKTSAENWYTNALATWKKANSNIYGKINTASPAQRTALGGQGMSGINV